MRVLLVNKFPHVTGGADVHCRGVADLLRERGHDVALLSTDGAHDGWEGEFVTRRVVHADRDTLRAAARLDVARRAFWNAEAADAMRRLLESFKPDVVHAHKLYPQLSVAPVAVARRAGVPVVQTIHDHEFIAANATDDRRRWIDWMEDRFSYRTLNTATQLSRRTLHRRSVTQWIAVSRYVAALMGAKGVHATVLPNFAEPTSSPLPPFEERSGVLFVGRLRWEKGLADVVELARRLPHIPVTVLGSGVAEAYVRSAQESLTNLTLVGSVPQDEVAGYLRAARIAILPSLWNEAGPLSALEAMAQGTPVVAYDAGGLGEYVGDARAGLLASGIDSLVDGTLILHDFERRWQDCSTRGIEAIATVHSPARYADGLTRIYETAVRGVTVQKRRRTTTGDLGTVVLAYHRIAAVSQDPFGLAVSPDAFREQLIAMLAVAVPRSLDDLYDDSGGTRREPGLVVTFDDGYVDNLVNALPILEELGVPATVFVVSGQVDRFERFWWDQLAILAASQERSSRELTRLWRQLRVLDPEARQDVLAEVFEPDAVAAAAGSSDDRAMTAAELRKLTASGLVRVGAHTVTHPVLSHLSPDRQRHEIRASKLDLEDIVNAPVTAFAYPYGDASLRRLLVHAGLRSTTRMPDYDRSTLIAVRQVGFRVACTTNGGAISTKSSPLQVPRITVRNWSGDLLKEHALKVISRAHSIGRANA